MTPASLSLLPPFSSSLESMTYRGVDYPLPLADLIPFKEDIPLPPKRINSLSLTN
jgi:hypothetical protein